MSQIEPRMIVLNKKVNFSKAALLLSRNTVYNEAKAEFQLWLEFLEYMFLMVTSCHVKVDTLLRRDNAQTHSAMHTRREGKRVYGSFSLCLFYVCNT